MRKEEPHRVPPLRNEVRPRPWVARLIIKIQTEARECGRPLAARAGKWVRARRVHATAPDVPRLPHRCALCRLTILNLNNTLTVPHARGSVDERLRLLPERRWSSRGRPKSSFGRSAAAGVSMNARSAARSTIYIYQCAVI